MLLSVVSVLAVAQSSSEVPEGLMNNPVQVYILFPTQSWDLEDALWTRLWQCKNNNIKSWTDIDAEPLTELTDNDIAFLLVMLAINVCNMRATA